MSIPEPGDRYRPVAHLLEAPLETAHDAGRIEVRRAAIEQVQMRRRRIEIAAELAVGGIGRQPRGAAGNSADDDQQDKARGLHAVRPSRTRGSAANSSRSAMTLPNARKTPPIAAQPATR